MGYSDGHSAAGSTVGVPQRNGSSIGIDLFGINVNALPVQFLYVGMHFAQAPTTYSGFGLGPRGPSLNLLVR